MMILKIYKNGNIDRRMWWSQAGDSNFEWLTYKHSDDVFSTEIKQVLSDKVLLETSQQKRSVIRSFLECDGVDDGY